MALRNKVIRIFISSTFEDMRTERDILQRKVYPHLLSICAPRGWQVDFVDLRWGISKDAGIQQKTMRICLEELKRCREVSPRPNFLILQGQRYGWCPLPETVEVCYWTDLEKAAEAEGCADLLRLWYRRDDNNLPPCYELRGKDEFAESHYDTDYEAYERDVEAPLRRVMRRFVATRKGLTYEECSHFVASATEQEILHGALARDVVPQQVAAYIREVNDLDPEHYAGPLLDAPAQRAEAAEAISRLKERIEKQLKPEPHAMRCCSLPLMEYLAENYKDVAEKYLKELLEELVLHEMEEYESVKKRPWEVECYRQEAFVEQRARFFQGRGEVLDKAEDFVDRGERLFCIEGQSGAGKSSVMAKLCCRLSQRGDLTVLFRSVGEGSSTSGQAVLCSLLQELQERYGVEGLDYGMEKMSYAELLEQCHRLMYTYKGRRLVLMVDALDQLPKYDPMRSFDWLPLNAEGDVSVLVSRIVDDQSAPLPASAICWLDSLSTEGREVGRRILLDNMRVLGRTLTERQQETVLDVYEHGGHRPIFLKMLSGMAAEWRADAEVSEGSDYTLSTEAGRQRVTLPTDVSRLAAGFFALLGGKDRHGMIVREVLAFLALTRRGVADGEVQRLLSLDEDFMDYFRKNSFHDYKAVATEGDALQQLAFPSSIWTRLYYDMKFLLSEHIVVGGAVNSFNHRQVYEGAMLYLATVDYDQSHAFRLLTSYFGERYRLHDTRALEELPRVLKKSGRVEEQARLLTDIDFIQGKVQNGLVFDLVNDYRVALETIRAQVGTLTADDLMVLQAPETSREQYKILLDKGVLLRQAQTLQALMDFVVQEIALFVDFAGEHRHFTLQLLYNVWADGPLAALADTYMERAASSLPEMYLRINRPPYEENRMLVQKLLGHSWCVNALAVSADGTRVVTASDDHQCKVWDMQQRKTLRTYFGHRSQVSALAVTADFGEAWSGAWDGEVLHWDVSSGLTKHSYVPLEMARVTALALSPQGGCYAAYEDGRCLWLQDGCERMLYRFGTGVSYMAVSQGRLLAGLSDGTVHALDGENWSAIYTLEGEVRCLASLADGGVLASTAQGHFYHLAGGVAERLFSLPTREQVTPNDYRFTLSETAGLLAVVDDYNIQVMTLEGRRLCILEGHTKDVAAVALLAGGRRLFSAGRDRRLMEWNMDLLSHDLPSIQPDNHTDSRYRKWFDKLVYLSRQTSRMEVLAASNNGRVVKWASKEATGTLVAEGVGAVYALDVAPDGHTVLCSSGDADLFLLDLDRPGHKEHLPKVHTTFVNAVRFAPTGRYAASNAIDENGSGEGVVLTIWNLQERRPLHRLTERDLTGHDVYAVGGVASDNGIHPVTGRYIYSRLADAPTMDNIVYINGSHGIAFSPCGRLLAVACRDGNVALVDVASGRTLRHLGAMSRERNERCHTSEVKSVAFSPDGHYLYSGSWDNSVIVWNLYARSGSEFVIRLVGHHRGIYSLDVAADGKTMVSGANDHSFIIWNVDRALHLAAQGHVCASCRDGVAINRVVFDANCNSVAFTRDGVVAGLGSGDVAVVENSKGETLRDVPFVTATRTTEGEEPVVDCPCCGSRFKPSAYKMERVEQETPYPSLRQSQVPPEALAIICPKCHNILRLNHFNSA